MSKRSVLLTCAGLRVDVVRAFREALDGLGWDGDVVAVDANPLAPALVKADRGVVVPPASSPDYLPALAELVRAHGVRADHPASPSPQTVKPLWEIAADLLKDVPQEVLERLPTDGAAQHDHYIYGTPKRAL